MNVYLKLLTGFIIFLFISSGFASGIQDGSKAEVNSIIEIIKGIPDKIQTANEIIGNRNVKYWSHIINDINSKLIKTSNLKLIYINDNF